MASREDISVSFYENQNKAGPQARRVAGPASVPPHFAQQQPMRPSPIPASTAPSFSGPAGAGLPFFSFDIGSTSIPPPSTSTGFGGANYGSFEDEAPLLEELGINPSQIWQKSLAVLNPLRTNPDLHEDADLSGPFLFCMVFGLCQLLAGKLNFGVILGWGLVASIFLYVVFNLLAGTNGSLDLYRCCSLVGYCMIPMIMLSALAIFIPSRGASMLILTFIFVAWCTRACLSLLVVLAPHAEEHRYLVAYPCIMIYSAFALLVLF